MTSVGGSSDASFPHNINLAYLHTQCTSLCEHNVDLMALKEHWLTPKDSAVKAEICPDGYSILVHERSDHRGGGTGLLSVSRMMWL